MFLPKSTKFGGADLQRLAVQRAFAKQRFFGRACGLLPRLPKVGGPAKADERPQPRAGIDVSLVFDPDERMQAIGAVVPDAIVDQHPAGIARVIRAAIAAGDTQRADRQLERIVAANNRLTGER